MARLAGRGPTLGSGFKSRHPKKDFLKNDGDEENVLYERISMNVSV